jgi:hypothetical protein
MSTGRIAETDALRTVRALRYVTALREGGSLPGLVEADDDGLYVLKFRGAGQGPKALVAEVVSGQLARALGLPVPDIVLVELDPEMGAAEPDYEIRHLIQSSGGRNFGIDFLPGSLAYSATVKPVIDPDLAANVVWFDAFVTNIDRTPRNPNIVVWHRRPWLIDHGSSLYVHFTWQKWEEHATQPFTRISEHVLLPAAGSILEADLRLAPLVSRELLERILRQVPDEWLNTERQFEGIEQNRLAYVEYLLRRVANSQAFVAEAEGART